MTKIKHNYQGGEEVFAAAHSKGVIFGNGNTLENEFLSLQANSVQFTESEEINSYIRELFIDRNDKGYIYKIKQILYRKEGGNYCLLQYSKDNGVSYENAGSIFLGNHKENFNNKIVEFNTKDGFVHGYIIINVDNKTEGSKPDLNGIFTDNAKNRDSNPIIKSYLQEVRLSEEDARMNQQIEVVKGNLENIRTFEGNSVKFTQSEIINGYLRELYVDSVTEGALLRIKGILYRQTGGNHVLLQYSVDGGSSFADLGNIALGADEQLFNNKIKEFNVRREGVYAHGYIIVNIDNQTIGTIYPDQKGNINNNCRSLDASPTIQEYLAKKELDEKNQQMNQQIADLGNTLQKRKDNRLVRFINSDKADFWLRELYIPNQKANRKYKITALLFRSAEINLQIAYSDDNGQSFKNVNFRLDRDYGLTIPASNCLFEANVGGEMVFFILNLDDLKISDYVIQEIVNENTFNLDCNPVIKSYIQHDTLDTVRRINSNSGKTSFGSFEFEPLPLDGYSHIVIYGQSLSVGSNSYISVTGKRDAIVPNTYMIGRSVGDNTGVLSQLLGSRGGRFQTYLPDSFEQDGESPACNAGYALKRILNKTIYRNVKVIATAPGQGNRSIQFLSKNYTGTELEQTIPTIEQNRYHQYFLKQLDVIKEQTKNKAKCSAIVWMQGERNQMEDMPTTTEEYKTMVLQLKNDMQADIMRVYEQEGKPLFFVYQPARWTPHYPIVAEAFRQLAEENEDIILMSPIYELPSIENHLTSNGYRWYGEYIARAVASAMIDNDKYNSVLVRDIVARNEIVKNNKITSSSNYVIHSKRTVFYVGFSVPNPPLVFDTKTCKPAINRKFKNDNDRDFGFAVWNKGTSAPLIIDRVEIIGGNCVRLIMHDLIDDLSEVEIEYAGEATNALGNLRDSDRYISGSKLIDPNVYVIAGASSDERYTETTIRNIKEADNYPHRMNGSSLIDCYYPIHNWANTFRLKFS